MAMADAGASRLEEASLSGSSDLDGEALDVVQDVSNSVDASHELTTPRSGLAAENAAHLTAEAIADNDVDAKLTPAPEPELSDIALGEDHLEMEPAVQAARNMMVDYYAVGSSEPRLFEYYSTRTAAPKADVTLATEYFRCVARAAVTTELEVEYSDGSSQPVEGTIVATVEPGQVLRSLEVQTNNDGVQRIRTPPGWVSVTAKDGVELLQPVLASELLAASAERPRYKAMYDFEPEQPGDLKFSKGDVIELLDKPHEFWWEGRLELQPQNVGSFPYNYVQQLVLIRAQRDLRAGAELTVQLPDGWALQVLLPNGAAAGQEIEFAVPTAPPAASADSSQAVDEAKAVHDAQRRIFRWTWETESGREANWRMQRRRTLEEQKREMYEKISGELQVALNEQPTLRPRDPANLVAELEVAQQSGNDDELRRVIEKLNSSVIAALPLPDRPVT